MRSPRDVQTKDFGWPVLVAVVAVAAGLAGVWLVAVPLGIAAAARVTDLLR